MNSLTPKSILNQNSQLSTGDLPNFLFSENESQICQQAKQKNLASIALKSLNLPYQFIRNAAQLETALEPFQSASVIGFDCETTGLDPLQDTIRLLQLAIPKHPTLIVDLKEIDSNALTPLHSILTSNALKVGHNCKFDWQFLSQAGLTPSLPFFDTYLAYRILTAGLKKNCSLEALTAKFLGIKLDKSLQQSDFRFKLSPAQLQYAAADAAVLLPLYRILKNKLEKASLTRTARDEFNCLPAVAQIYLDLEKWPPPSIPSALR